MALTALLSAKWDWRKWSNAFSRPFPPPRNVFEGEAPRRGERCPGVGSQKQGANTSSYSRTLRAPTLAGRSKPVLRGHLHLTPVEQITSGLRFRCSGENRPRVLFQNPQPG